MPTKQNDNTRDEVVARTISVVANPAAGSGRFSRLRERLVRILEADGWVVEVSVSRGPGECQKLAAQAASGSVVCAAGGDGTVNEVVNGLLAAGTGNSFTVFPCGTGNDFAKAIGLPDDPLEAAKSYAGSTKRHVDVASVSWSASADHGPTVVDAYTHERYFCNVVGMGLDAAAARRAVRLKRMLGGLSYTVAVISTLARWIPSRLRVELANSHATGTGDGDIVDVPSGMLVSVCNGPRSGGAFLLTPDALIDDGLLDVCAVAYPGFLRGLRLLPGVRHGRHVTQPEVSIRQATEVTFSFERSQDLHIDGELVDGRAGEVHVRIHPRSLAVIGGERR